MMRVQQISDPMTSTFRAVPGARRRDPGRHALGQESTFELEYLQAVSLHLAADVQRNLEARSSRQGRKGRRKSPPGRSSNAGRHPGDSGSVAIDLGDAAVPVMVGHLQSPDLRRIYPYAGAAAARPERRGNLRLGLLLSLVASALCGLLLLPWT